MFDDNSTQYLVDLYDLACKGVRVLHSKGLFYLHVNSNTVYVNDVRYILGNNNKCIIFTISIAHRSLTQIQSIDTDDIRMFMLVKIISYQYYFVRRNIMYACLGVYNRVL